MTATVVAGILVVVLAAGWAIQTANRLDRLNVRVDLARQALESTLDRRAVVARAIAADMTAAEPLTAGEETSRTQRARALAAVADRAERAPAERREQAENAVSAALAAIDITERAPGLIAELADAETRVMIARRFYNDAVRDTRVLAERRAVRWLRLGGTAGLPEYFEIIERGAADNDDI